MTNRPLPQSIPLLMAAALLFGGVAAQASSLGQPGGGSSEEESANANLYLAAGATAVVLGVILYDIFSDAAAEEESADSAAASVEDTGVDWESVPVAGGDTPAETGNGEGSQTLSLVVEILPGDGGSAEADRLAARMGLLLADAPVDVRPNSVDLGRDYTADEKARMVSDFFASDLFLAFRALEDGILAAFLLDGNGVLLAADTLREADPESLSSLVRQHLTR